MSAADESPGPCRSVLLTDPNPGGNVKFLLCSSGISNPSIEAALVELLGKPIA